MNDFVKNHWKKILFVALPIAAFLAGRFLQPVYGTSL